MKYSPAGGSAGFALYALIPLDEFKALLSVDDREDCLDFASMRNQGYEFLHGKNSTNLFQPPSLAAFCLVTATYTIEQYCKRRLVKAIRKEQISISKERGAMSKGDPGLKLSEERYRENLRKQQTILEEFAVREIEWADDLLSWYRVKQLDMPDDQYRAVAFFKNREYLKKPGSLTLLYEMYQRNCV